MTRTSPARLKRRTARSSARGICFNKFTGSRGKSGSNDANPEFMASLRKIMDDDGRGVPDGGAGPRRSRRRRNDRLPVRQVRHGTSSIPALRCSACTRRMRSSARLTSTRATVATARSSRAQSLWIDGDGCTSLQSVTSVLQSSLPKSAGRIFLVYRKPHKSCRVRSFCPFLMFTK